MQSRLEELHTAAELVREGLKPMPLRIRFYLDSYRAQLVAKRIATLSIQYAQDVLAGASCGDSSALQRWLNFEVTPGKLASLITGALSMVENSVVGAYEQRLRDSGFAVASNKDLFDAAFSLTNPFVLRGALQRQPTKLEGDTFVDIASDGLVFAPRPIDRRVELARLRRLRRNAKSDVLGWHDANQRMIAEGKFIQRSGEIIDVGFSETFVEEVASRLGVASREGHYRVWWSESLTLKEKGVDADLIIKVMDDIQSGEVDVFAFFTNDSDFAPLIRRLKSDGKDVILCGTGVGVSLDLIDAIGSESTFFDLTGPDVVPGLDVWLTSDEFQVLELLNHVTSQHGWYQWMEDQVAKNEV